MGDVVSLRAPIDIHSDAGRAFIVDATRAGEGIISDQELQELYELSPSDLQAIANDAAVGRAIRLERTRRLRNGVAARELAAKFFVKGPAILDQIASSAANDRHKIDALRELRTTAHGSSDGDGPASKGELFSIVINLGSDVSDRIEKVFDKPRAPVLEDDGNGDQWG